MSHDRERGLGRRILSALFGDLGLKLVALVLAGVTWYLVRNQLQTAPGPITVRVDVVDVPSTIRIRPDVSRTTTLTLAGTKGTVELAAQAIERAGHRIQLRMPPVGESAPTGWVAGDTPDEFTFPFESRSVVSRIAEPLRIEWFRVGTIELDLEKPALEPADADFAAGYPTLDTTRVKVTGPIAEISRLRDGREESDRLRLDPVDATTWIRDKHDLATPFLFTSGFSRWRALEPALRAGWLLTIEPAAIGGKAKVREIRPTSVKLDVAQLHAPGTDPNAYRPFEVRIADAGFDARTRKLDVIVRGDSAAVAEVAGPRGGWIVVVDLPAPPDDPSASVENVSARIRLVPRDPVTTTSRLTLISPSSVYVSIVPRKP